MKKSIEVRTGGWWERRSFDAWRGDRPRWRANAWFATGLTLVNLSAAAEPASSSELVAAARERTQQQVIYDGSYRRLDYPMGDVPNDRGVCSDVVIRAYRGLGVDLQRLVHEDMAQAFDRYPKTWGLKRTDRNIDHRRVPNLEMFFARHGKTLATSRDPREYAAGDLVSWRLPGNLPHIGIVSDRFVPGTERPLIIHNVGAGPKEEDVLFAYRMTGHYRYAVH